MDAKDRKEQADNMFASLREVSAEEAEKFHPILKRMWDKANTQGKE